MSPIILVHGLWMNGIGFGVLRRRLQRDYGFDVHEFPYPSLTGDAAATCDRLAQFAAQLGGGGRVHLVGHSLGGALVYRTLSEHAEPVLGNAVLLGSPLRDCKAAQGAARWPVLRSLLGPHVASELIEARERHWQGQQAVGAIAGCRRIGTGRLLARFDEDNDGTVAVSETIIPGLADHLVLRHSHVGMLFARDVARQVACFLRDGRFVREAAAG